MLKKHVVRIPYHTYFEVNIIADESVSNEDIISRAQEMMECEMEGDTQLLDNLQPDGDPEVTTADIFPDKDAAYGELCSIVDHEGGYLVIREPKERPLLLIENDDVEADGEPNKMVKVKSLYQSDDESSPLKFIDENDESWDVDDFLTQAQITYIYAVLKKLEF